MKRKNVAMQFFDGIQWINAALWPMTQIGTNTKIGMTLQCHQRGVRVPVMAKTSPVFVNGNLHSVSASKTINAIPHVQWRLASYKPNAQLFGNVKLFFPRVNGRVANNIN